MFHIQLPRHSFYRPHLTGYYQPNVSQNPHMVIDLKFFTERVSPLFMMTGEHFTPSSVVPSGEDTRLFSIFSLPDFQNEVVHIYDTKYFLNWFVVNFFSPHIGENISVVLGGRGHFFPVMVCTLNKIFPFLQILALLLNTRDCENNLFHINTVWN